MAEESAEKRLCRMITMDSSTTQDCRDHTLEQVICDIERLLWLLRFSRPHGKEGRAPDAYIPFEAVDLMKETQQDKLSQADAYHLRELIKLTRQRLASLAAENGGHLLGDAWQMDYHTRYFEARQPAALTDDVPADETESEPQGSDTHA